jgi:hypothetical protein
MAPKFPDAATLESLTMRLIPAVVAAGRLATVTAGVSTDAKRASPVLSTCIVLVDAPESLKPSMRYGVPVVAV